MSTLTIAIIITFCVGYFLIAIESVTKVNKAAIALLMFVLCWTLFMVSPGSYMPGFSGPELVNEVSAAIERHLGSTSTTLDVYKRQSIYKPLKIILFIKCDSLEGIIME